MKYKINLITRRKEKPVDRIIFFVLNYLRYILVLTQIVVIIVFFYRFKIDQEMVDLQESTAQKKEIIQVSQPLILEAKKNAYKLDQARMIINKQSTTLQAIEYLLSLFPESLFLTKLRLSDDKITMIGFTQNSVSVDLFYRRVNKEAKFKEVNLKNIKKIDSGIEFTFEFKSFKLNQPI